MGHANAKLEIFVIFCCVNARMGGILPYKKLMWMCRSLGSHFHDWIDYNGVAFFIELLESGRAPSDVLGKTVLHIDV